MEIWVLLLMAVMPLVASTAQRGSRPGRRPTLNESTMLVPVIEGEVGKTYRNVTSDGSELHYVFRIESMGKTFLHACLFS